MPSKSTVTAVFVVLVQKNVAQYVQTTVEELGKFPQHSPAKNFTFQVVMGPCQVQISI